MTNKNHRGPSSKIVDYFPLLAYFGFWLQGAAISSILTRDPKLMLLGLVTLPALAALGLAAKKIGGIHRAGKG